MASEGDSSELRVASGDKVGIPVLREEQKRVWCKQERSRCRVHTGAWEMMESTKRIGSDLLLIVCHHNELCYADKHTVFGHTSYAS